MKKIYWLLMAAVFSLPVFTNAQQNKVDIGLEGSPGVALFWGSDVTIPFNSPVITVAGGLFVQYNLSDHFALRTNAWYETKGSVAKGNELDKNNNVVAFSTANHFNYLTVPLLGRYTHGIHIGSAALGCFVNVGPYMGMLLSQSTVRDGITSATIDNSSNYKKTDLGLSVGIGFEYPLKNKFGLSFEVRNNLGLVNISNIPLYNDGSIMTNSTNFLFGFAYKLGAGAEASK